MRKPGGKRALHHTEGSGSIPYMGAMCGAIFGLPTGCHDIAGT